MRARYVVIGLALLLALTLGRGFLLHTDAMFGFHDLTQAARVKEFALNLTTGNIPPRIAPHFDYGRGYPVFNHYAPLGYYITSLLHMTGMGIPSALKVSFALAAVLAGVGMFLFARHHMSDVGAGVAGLLYMTSPYLGTDIFVRGNLAEVWFMAVFPFVLWRVDVFEKKPNRRTFLILSVGVACMLLAHNALSLIGGGVVLVYALSYRSWKSIGALVVGVLLSAAHTVPAIMELGMTHATKVAQKTLYMDHFLCLRQVWDSPIGYAGSMAGCIDGMSFQIGKIVIIMGVFGGVGWLLHMIRTKTFRTHPLWLQHSVVAGYGLVSAFLIYDVSAPVWEALPQLHVFQFPWRFLAGVVFVGAFFAGIGVNSIVDRKLGYMLASVAVGLSVVLSIPFFKPNPSEIFKTKQYVTLYLSDEFIAEDVVYRIPEYVPTSATYDTWMTDTFPALPGRAVVPDGGSVELIHETPFSFDMVAQAPQVTIDIHEAPFWKVMIDGKAAKPSSRDEIGRPTYELKAARSLIEVSVVETPLQRITNIVSLATGVLLVGTCLLWKPRR